MLTPSTDSLYDGRENLHQFTDPMSSAFWETREQVDLPSSPPLGAAGDVDMDDAASDEATDADTDADTDDDGHQTLKNRTLRVASQNSAAQAVHKRSFSTQEIDASQFVQRVIDDPDKMIDSKGTLLMNFDASGMDEVPIDWKDLRHAWATSTQVNIMLFLARNSLRQLPVFLFDLNITVLSLRDNQISQLPASVANLKQLRELHVGGNRIEYLPYELAFVQSLKTLTCTPNPLLQPGPNAQVVHGGYEVAFEARVKETPPTLLSIATATYCDELYPQHLGRLSEYLQGTIKGARVERCYRCRAAYIEESAAIVKWMNIFRQTSVPFKLGFCSRRCYYAYAFPHSSDV